MSANSKKQFGVWMDSHNATVVGKDGLNADQFTVLSHVKNEGAGSNSNENTSNNQEISMTLKFFKEIVSVMPNVDEIHVTGTGQIQQQFINFLSDTPQYKNARSSESTSNKMSDEELSTFIMNQYN